MWNSYQQFKIVMQEAKFIAFSPNSLQ